jgi:RNA polymerase sigma-54 factor
MLRLDQHAKLQNRMGQEMRLAPRMIQSMEILQLPMMALEERIEQELESNVALERVEPGTDAEDQLPESRRDELQDERLDERLDQLPLVVQQDGSARPEDFARLSDLETRFEDAFDRDSTWQRPPGRLEGERDRKLEAMANAPARGESLIEQLQHQWSFSDQEPEIAAAGRLLIDYIDDDGRLGADFDTILAQVAERGQGDLPDGSPLDRELLERALLAVQRTLEPRGLAGRDVRECLRIQVEARLEEAESEEERRGWGDVLILIERHFGDLLQNRVPRIERESGMSLDRFDAARVRMARLRLWPGRDVVDESVPPIMPDVIVEFDEERQRYAARLSEGRLPSLRVSPRYERMAKDRAVEKSARDFLAASVRSASWLIDSIAQRRSTLLRVVEAVIERQRDWFEHGAMHLRPLPMIDVADQLGIHVGTVSRAVADKWMQTPKGLVPLRRFFSGGTETRDGQDVSWDAVKAQVKEIVEREDPACPLSDQAIAGRLLEKGVTLARRTVVKYREQLGIPPARRRKRHGPAR